MTNQTPNSREMAGSGGRSWADLGTQFDTPQLTARLWENPFKIVSLWDMERLAAEVFVEFSALFANFSFFDFADEEELAPRQKMLVGATLIKVEKQCKKIGLRTSIQHVKDMLLSLETRYKWKACKSDFHYLGLTIKREMKTKLFMFIPAEQAEKFKRPLRNWAAIINRFPHVRTDVKESSYCFACDRFAASVFHILLVAEYGVIQVSDLIGVKGDKPGWGALKRIEDALEKAGKDRSPLVQKHSKFLESVSPLLKAMKDSWRHKITHVDNWLEWNDTDFSPQVAEEIISATRGFMRRLAQELPGVTAAP